MDFTKFRPGQEQSIRHLEGPLLISAGAGSGKTFTLTQRIAWALLPGSAPDGGSFLSSIDEALVITFTEKAAAEIKDRIRSTLRAEGMLDEALKVDAAWISTIHGMCNRILREHALEIGLDPAFTVLGAPAAEELRTSAMNTMLEEVQDNVDGSYAALFETFGVEKVADYVGSLLTKGATLSAGLEQVEFGPVGTPLSQRVAQVCALAQSIPPGGKEANYAAAEQLVTQLQSYMAGAEDPAALADILQACDLRNFGTKVCAELKAAIKEARLACRVGPYRQHAVQLVDLAREVDQRYQQQLDALGQIDMAGLIRRTLAAFSVHPEIATQYSQRFKLIMVDEFQDTSQLQIDMIECLAGAAKQRLCTVGDAQQSIYRFQGADVSVYLRHKQSMLESGATLVQLDENFRSHADILAFVRAVCGQPGFFQEDFLDLQAAGQGKPYKGGGPRIEVAFTKYGHSAGQGTLACETEARYIAQRFAQLKAAGHSPASMVLLLGRLTKADMYAQALREAGLACVVTGGSKYFESAHVRVCQSILDVLANPYNSESLLELLTSEALPVNTSDLLYLSTTVNPDTGQPTRQNPARAFLVADAAPAQGSLLLVHAQQVLQSAWEKLGRMRPAQLFLDVVVQSGWLARLEAGGAESSAKAADVLKFARLVEEVQAQNGFDMVRVAAAMREAAFTTQEQPGALSVENLDAVRIMTIHKSKGLEFPIVAVADCFEVHSHGSALASYSEGQTMYVSLQGAGGNADLAALETAAGPAQAQEPAEFRANIVGANAEKDYEERKRLFYVATTRASAALIVGLRARWSKSGGYAPLVHDVLAGLCPGEEDFPTASCEIAYGGSEPLQFTCLSAPGETAEGTGEEVADQAQPPQAQPVEIMLPQFAPAAQFTEVPCSLRTNFCSYSSLAEHYAGTDEAQDSAADILLAVEPLWAQNEGESEDAQPIHATTDADKATNFGSALHRACEWLALQPADPSEAKIQNALARFAQEFGVIDQVRLQAAFHTWQASEARSWAQSFQTQQPEVPFVVQLDQRILEGEMDLLCTSGTKAGIVDYKTGGSAAETPEQLQAKHLLQAQCYAYATLSAGFEEVELHFVRVEQPDPANSVQPQTVSYHFAKDELNALHQAITRATMD